MQRFANSAHGSSSNIYDSWRSQHRRSSPSTISPADAMHHNYYDANYYAQKAPNYPPPLPPDPYGLMDAHHASMMMDHHQLPQQHLYHQQQQQPRSVHQLHQHLQYDQQNPYGYSGGGSGGGGGGGHHGPSSSSARRAYQSRDYDPDF